MNQWCILGGCHCEHIRHAQCKLREAIPVFRLLRHGVYPELSRRILRNDSTLFALLENIVGIKTNTVNIYITGEEEKIKLPIHYR
jgi:hypothetical protein